MNPFALAKYVVAAANYWPGAGFLLPCEVSFRKQGKE